MPEIDLSYRLERGPSWQQAASRLEASRLPQLIPYTRPPPPLPHPPRPIPPTSPPVPPRLTPVFRALSVSDAGGKLLTELVLLERVAEVLGQFTGWLFSHVAEIFG